MEAFHVVATHPQLLAGIGDANSQYDWEGNCHRAITPNGTPSPHIKFEPSRAADVRRDERPAPRRGPVRGARRRRHGPLHRRQRRALPHGATCSGRTPTSSPTPSCRDSIYYTLFPNLHPWGAYNRITYRFRPYGDRHDMAIMECMFLDPWPEGEPKPPAVPIHWLGVDDDWTEAPELGMLARVFNQDSFNLPEGAEGPGLTDEGHHPGQLPGDQDPPLPPPAHPVRRGLHPIRFYVIRYWFRTVAARDRRGPWNRVQIAAGRTLTGMALITGRPVIGS